MSDARDGKILNNDYNSGNIDYDIFVGEMKISPIVSSQYEDQTTDDIEGYHNTRMLDKEVYDIFLKSPYYAKYKNPKKIDKNDLVKMYYYFKELLVKSQKYTHVEIYIAFSEFFQVNYDVLYSEIGVLDKEALLRELSEKYKVKHKITTKRLF